MRLEGHDMRYFEIVPSPPTRGEAVLAEIVPSTTTSSAETPETEVKS